LVLNWRVQKLILAFAIITGCSSVAKIVDQPHQVSAPSSSPQYNRALQKIEQGKYAEGRADLENFLQAVPVSSYTQVAHFNIAYSLELERQFKEAAEKYREVSISTLRAAPKLQAYALYRLSYCLEAIGDDAQVVAVLDDVNQRKHLLTPEVATAELPARQAAAYSRVGNVDLAQKLYSQAETAMLRYRRKSSQETPEWLAKTLYHMGRTNLRDASWENFEVVVRPLGKTQQFLLEAAELDHELWSKRASEDLAVMYKNLWTVIQTPPSAKGEHDIIHLRAIQQRQWEMTFQLVDLLDDLKRYRLRDQNSQYVQMLFRETEKVNREVRALLAVQKVGSELTPAARKRILGQRRLPRLPSKSKTKSLPVLVPPPASDAQPKTETDPNL